MVALQESGYPVPAIRLGPKLIGSTITTSADLAGAAGRRRAIAGCPACRGPHSKNPIVALVERGAEAHMFHLENATVENVREVLVRNASRESELHTDESRLCVETSREFASHHTVRHSAKEHVRYEGERIVHFNTVENVF
jgi:hypothetical protein